MPTKRYFICVDNTVLSSLIKDQPYYFWSAANDYWWSFPLALYLAELESKKSFSIYRGSPCRNEMQPSIGCFRKTYFTNPFWNIEINVLSALFECVNLILTKCVVVEKFKFLIWPTALFTKIWLYSAVLAISDIMKHKKRRLSTLNSSSERKWSSILYCFTRNWSE